MRLFGADDIGRWIAVFDDRHFADTLTGFHGSQYRRVERADVYVEPARQNDIDVFVLLFGRDQYRIFVEIPAIATL